MWPFTNNLERKIRRRFKRFDESLETSFSRVKQDTGNLGNWVTYLNQRSQSQEEKIKLLSEEISTLNEELSVVPKTPEDIKRIIDTYYSYESMLNRVRAIETRVEEIVIREPIPSILPSQKPAIRSSEIEELRQKIEALEGKKLTLKEKIVKRVTRNSKEYLKGIILSYVRKYEQVGALQLKEMVVDDQGLCSKSSFYRLMEEIEEEHELGIVREGKEKHYFLKAIRKNG